MSDSVFYPSILAKKLKTDILSTDTVFKLRDIKWFTGSDGADVNLDSSIFGTGNIGYGCFEPNTARQEFFTFNPANMATATSTGLTIIGRGLPMGSDYSTEASSRKFNHASGSAVLLSTNAPALYNTFANRTNDETITGVWTFSQAAAMPRLNAQHTYGAGEEEFLATKRYADSLAIAGAPDANTTTKGIVELATQSENDAGTATGGTGASLVAPPNLNAKSIQDAKWTYAADAGGSDDYAITLVPTPAAYTEGQTFVFKANTANTGSATLNVNGLGAKTIKKNHDQDLETGDIEAASIIVVTYDGTNFQMHTQQASMPSTATLSSVGSFFAAAPAQGISSTFTAGENLAANDLVASTAADTVKRHSPTALPSAFDQSATLATTAEQDSNVRNGTFVQLTTSLYACIYCDSNVGTPVTEVVRIPVTPSTGAIGTISKAGNVMTAVTPPGSIDAVKISSTHILLCASELNVFRGMVIDLSSGITLGTEVVVDTSNVLEGFCDYISDSHVLFFSRDTTADSIQFYKYTLSGTTLTLSSSGTVITLAGDSFVLKGVRRFEGTNDFLFLIQNDTDVSAQAIIARYDTGSSTFTPVGAATNLTSNQNVSNVFGHNAVFVPLSSTQTIVMCPTSTTAGIYLLIYRSDASSTTPLFGSISSTTTSGASAGYSLTKANARCAFLNTQNGTTATIKLLELNSAGTGLTERATTTRTTTPGGNTLEINKFTACFHVNPTRMGIFSFDGAADDYAVGTGTYTLPPSVGLIPSAIASAASGTVNTHGYSTAVSGLTAGSKYYADIGGIITTDGNGSPDNVGVAKDDAEIIIKSW